MRLAELVAAAREVAGTRSRRRKIALLADVLRRLGTDEIEVGAGFLAGQPRQARLGIGWRTASAVDPPRAAEPSLTLADVDEALQTIADAAGTGSRAVRTGTLEGLLARATADEQAFLRGLVLGELRQGALAGILAQAIAAAWGLDERSVRRAAMLAGDLGAVAQAAARGGEEALGGFRLELLRPVQPMLAQTAATLGDALTGAAVLVERKLDGARIQVHRVGDQVRVFTRSLRDVTGEHPAVVAVARTLPAERFVLDGEALALRPDGRPAAFQDTMRRALDVTPFFFDVLHFDGEDVLDTPLAARREALERLVPAPHRIPGVVTAERDEAEAVLAEALADGHEGVMVKDLDAPYEAGRRGAAWRKVKPAHTLDLVVLAVEWGSGRRRGWLSNLHLGARAEDGFVMLGKTFKGLTDELLDWQTRELLAREVRREGHIVHVRPELVVEIAFDGVQTSPRYAGGLALRFARVKRYRTDKAPEEADTIATVRALHAGGHGDGG
jgi:DNA ligase 1